ncbi:hypothetical protein [Pseudofrankia sp. BMG5.36]|uniref:hypothetical protein n=1 Tax=Pseudofrankia sp. BMG5.36 TaxID=1834512 RepID=UPI0008DA448D|nr:hypothetical protein [Pseudofrankia sp. BMG5.36]OHV68183.1 hypothetical protein BCD48_03055 [Pseudofrankia sp. BMG5.36]
MDGDADLVARVRRGDRQAFDDLYDRYADDVFSMCVVVLGDPTVARAAAGTAFALVARTRMNPLSEPARLRSWLLELARGSALAWSGSPQARSAPVPHGISAEDMIDGAVVPAPASLRAGLARTFDRAASAAAHERAAQERLAARTDYGMESSGLPVRTTGAAIAMAGAAAFADSDPDTDTEVDATRRDVAGAIGLGAVAVAGLADAPTIVSGATGGTGAAAAGGAGSAGSNLAAAAADKGTAAAQADGGNLAQAAADHLTKAAQGTTKSAGAAHADGGNAAQAAADHLTKAAGHDPAGAAGLHGHAAEAHGHAVGVAKASGGDSAATSHAAAGHGNAANAAQQAQSAQWQGAADAATSPGHLPAVDVDPPTVDVDLSELAEPNVVPFPAHRYDADGHYYADGQGAPLVPIDGVEGRRRHGPDWRTRPAIAVAASLVVAVAGITAALNWPAPTAQLSAQDFPDVAIVAPSLEVGKTAGTGATGRPTPPGPTAAPTVGVSSLPGPGGQPRLVSDDRPIATTTPAPPTRAGASSAPVTPPPPETTTKGTSSGPSPTRTTSSPTPSPTRTTTSPTPSPTRTTTSPTPGDGGAPTTPAQPTSSTPSTPPAAPKTTNPPTIESNSGTSSLPGTVGSGNTANI